MKNEYSITVQESKIGGGTSDAGVPSFGGFEQEDLRPQIERDENTYEYYREDARKVLQQSAVDRSLFFSGVKTEEVPRVHFPNGEFFQHFGFPNEFWENYDTPESEYGRLQIMLFESPNRSFPVEFNNVVEDCLESEEEVLETWQSHSGSLNMIKNIIFKSHLHETNANKSIDMAYIGMKEGTNVSAPPSYESSDNLDQYKLFQNGLEQISSELIFENSSNVGNFLDLYNHMKDPVTPICADLKKQSEVFMQLYNNAINQCNEILDSKQHQILVTQLALESSFLSLPEFDEVFYVRQQGHQELSYIPIKVENLPRAELSNPQRVAGNEMDEGPSILDKIFDDALAYGEPVITPIAVGHFQLPNAEKPELFIVDGNNRATAIFLLTYLHQLEGFYDVEKPQDLARLIKGKNHIEEFISNNGNRMDIEWERDLRLSLGVLANNPNLLEKIISNKDLAQAFSETPMPGLLVQEANHFTVDVVESEKPENMNAGKVKFLQPFVQSIFNQSEKGYSMAIASKKQSHGRAEANHIKIGIDKLS